MGRAAGIILLGLLIVGLTFFRSLPQEPTGRQAAVAGIACQHFQALPWTDAGATTGLPAAKPQQARSMAPSALVSDRSVAFYAMPSRTAGPGTVALGYTADGAFHPTALVIHHSAPRNLIELVAPGTECTSARTPRYGLLGVEHLYTFALTLDPLQQFALSVCESGTNCLTAERKPLLHAELLSALAVQRASHAQQVTQDKQNHPRWVTVSLTDAARDTDDRVSIKVNGEPAAFAGSSVAFSRRPHAGCIATVDSNGLATCTVEDPHGDEHSEDEENGPIIATYSGKLLPDLQFLPTTQVLPQKLGSSRMDQGKP